MLTVGFARAARADQVVQVPVDALLNARAVTTLTAGALVPWTVGVDGNGTADGYMTAAASRFHNDPATYKALPDDGRFPADARHPDVLLHFSNDAAATSQQTHFVRGAGTFTFQTPPAIYSKMFLFVTSSEGASAVKLTMTYADATEIVNVTVPDYFMNIPANDPVIFNLATDLPKWNQQHVAVEANHHNLTGLEIHPMAGKTLTSIQVDKTAAGYFVFWGATGIALGDGDGGIDGSIGDARPSADGAGDRDSGVVGAGGAAGQGGATMSGSGGTSGSGGGAGSGGLGSGGGVISGSAGSSVGSGGSSSTGNGGASGASSAAPAPSDTGCTCGVIDRRSSSSIAWSACILVAAAIRRRRGRAVARR